MSYLKNMRAKLVEEYVTKPVAEWRAADEINEIQKDGIPVSEANAVLIKKAQLKEGRLIQKNTDEERFGKER